MAFSNSPQFSTYQQKQLPFYGELLARAGNTPSKDQRYYNCFVESYKTPNTSEQHLYLRKRFGLLHQINIPNGVVRGCLSWDNVLYFVIGASAYKYTFGGVVTIIGPVTPGVTPVGIRPYNYYGDDLDYILFADGANLYHFGIVSQNYTINPSGYPTPHSPYFEVMDGYILMVRTGTSEIWSSQLNNWGDPWDVLNAEMYPDDLIGLSRLNNYIMAIGSNSIEMIYDAAIEDGSPFARNDSVVATIGCRAIGTAIQTDRRWYWLADTDEGNVSVWMMDDFKPTEIASPAVKMAINNDTANIHLATAYSCRTQGHHFYVLRLTTETWVYDVDEKFWYQWDYANDVQFPVVTGGELVTGQYHGIIDGAIVLFDPNYHFDLGLYPVRSRWQTSPITLDSMNRKFLHRFTIVGDSETNPVQIKVSWSDDNYKTWSPERLIDMNSPRPALVNCGYFRRRAFHFLCDSNTDMRIESMELTYNIGVN